MQEPISVQWKINAEFILSKILSPGNNAYVSIVNYRTVEFGPQIVTVVLKTRKDELESSTWRWNDMTSHTENPWELVAIHYES